MEKNIAVASIVALLITSTALAGDTPDKRILAHTVMVVAKDQLQDDRPVAACFALHLPDALPIGVETPHIAGDVIGVPIDLILRIEASVSGASLSRRYLGQARIFALTPDGREVWRAGYHNSAYVPADVPCLLADGLIDQLRKAMRKARDAK